MASKDYLPAADQTFLAWTGNFGRIINVSPTGYGITAEIAAEYTGQQAAFATTLQAATDPATRGKRTVFLKKQAKDALIATTRNIAQQINRTMSVTDAQRQQLGLNIASSHRKPVPVPGTSPFVKIVGTSGRDVTIQLQQDRSKRGRPPQVAAAMIFLATGPNAPVSTDGWTFSTNTTKTKITIPFPPSATGDVGWVTAFWTNSRQDSGPAASPVTINLPAGGMMAAEATQPVRMKAA